LLKKSPLAPLCQRGELYAKPPFAKGGLEGFAKHDSALIIPHNYFFSTSLFGVTLHFVYNAACLWLSKLF
jgi:hypothetical protein